MGPLAAYAAWLIGSFHDAVQLLVLSGQDEYFSYAMQRSSFKHNFQAKSRIKNLTRFPSLAGCRRFPLQKTMAFATFKLHEDHPICYL